MSIKEDRENRQGVGSIVTGVERNQQTGDKLALWLRRPDGKPMSIYPCGNSSLRFVYNGRCIIADADKHIIGAKLIRIKHSCNGRVSIYDRVHSITLELTNGTESELASHGGMLFIQM